MISFRDNIATLLCFGRDGLEKVLDATAVSRLLLGEQNRALRALPRIRIRIRQTTPTLAPSDHKPERRSSGHETIMPKYTPRCCLRGPKISLSTIAKMLPHLKRLLGKADSESDDLVLLGYKIHGTFPISCSVAVLYVCAGCLTIIHLT